jgi:putative holliday junction resolvase
MARIAAVDYGTKRIGVALSDPGKIIASPLTTLENGKEIAQTVARLLAVLAAHEIEEIVVGMPYHLSGLPSPLCATIRHFMEMLRQAQTAPVVAVDERLTTALAERLLKEQGLRRKQRSKIVDKLSAALLLQSHLDSCNRGSGD